MLADRCAALGLRQPARERDTGAERVGQAALGDARAAPATERRVLAAAPRDARVAEAEQREDVGAVLEALSKGLTQKMLHGTLAELRAADGDERTRLAQTVSRLFLRNGGRGGGDDKR